VRRASAASGAVFRIGFGLVGLILVVRFFAHGWIQTIYIDPAYHYTYPGFGWVRPWSPIGMYLEFLVLGAGAIGVALGYRYRLSALVFGLALAHVELMDRAMYLNHYYWASLTALVLVFLPVHRMWSLDANAGRVREPGWVPAWVVWGLRFQVGIVYAFAGLAKINGDWLLHGQPLATWLPARSGMFGIGTLLTLPLTAIVLSWAGALFDLTVVGWLSWRRTRRYVFVCLVLFHLSTWVLFPSIGVFPLLMSLAALVFFDPDWPLRFANSCAPAPDATDGRLRPMAVAATAVYLLVMIALPLRHYAVPGDVKWTGRGYLFSWQVMLSEKAAASEFVVTDPADGRSWTVSPPSYLTERQLMVMPTDPVMIRQTAQLIADDIGGVEVSARILMTLNGRPSAPLTDPKQVLARAHDVEGPRSVTGAFPDRLPPIQPIAEFRTACPK
jgi:vitamin K-dependent gamma-carboxylase